MQMVRLTEQVQLAWSSAQELLERVEQELEARGMLIQKETNQLVEH